MAAWLAVLAVVIMTMAPAISRALAAQAPVPAVLHVPDAADAALHDFCSGGGDIPASAQHPSSHHSGPYPGLDLEHCPFCHLHAEMLSLPALVLRHLPPAGLALRPLLFLQAPMPLHAWRTAQPRGPPAAC